MTQSTLGRVVRHIGRLVAADARRELSDTELLQHFAVDREEQAFASLFHRHGPLVWSICYSVLQHRQDTEDAFQATFLLLARRAGSIRKTEAVASWLYRVAHRVATKAGQNMARRRIARQECLAHCQEKQGDQRQFSPPETEAAWRELQAVLNEEVERLPEKYRPPFIMCCLEGKTGPEAARQLGWKVGTVTGRLTEARKLLQRRLSRRGVALSSVLAAVTVAHARAATASAALAEGTVKAALAFTTQATTAGLVSAKAAALVDAMAKQLVVTKLKVATAVLLTASVVTGVGMMTHQVLAGKPDAPQTTGKKQSDQSSKPLAAAEKTAKPQAPAAKETPDAVEFSGRVLDPDGKPFSGAKLHLIANSLDNARSLHVQTTGGLDGGFRIEVPAAKSRFYADEASWSRTCIVASAEGFGPAVGLPGAFASTADLTLRLAKDDVPVNGRVVDLQGKPLAGVQVHVDGINIPKAGTLNPWLEALEANKQDGYPIEFRFLERASLSPGVFPNLVSDAEGRFQIKGVGRERLVNLTLRGPTIVISRMSVMTRPGKPIHATMFARNPEGGRLAYYGATFEHAAAPSRPIIGVVRDKDTGKPLAGVPIQSHKFAGNNTGGDSSVRTVTDKDGRYRLVGMPKGEGNIIKAAPAKGQPYFQAQQEVANSPGLEPVRVDFALKRGVLVKGRVLDKATRQPLFANVQYLVFASNANYQDVPGFTTEPYLQTEEDGSFQLVGFPGRGLVAARCWNDHYRMAVGSEKMKDWYRDTGHLDTRPFLFHPTTVHTLVEIDPAEGVEALTCEILLDPGRMPGGTVVGPDGKPLAGTKAFGLTAYGSSRNWTRAPLKGPEFTVYGLDTTDEREVVFVHESKHLIGVMRVRGDSKKPIVVKLEPWGTVTGRLVTAEGAARPGVLLQIPDRLLPNPALQTDREGRFHVEGLAPDVKYTLEVVEKGNAVGRVFTALMLKAGEEKDLGDVQAQRNESRSGGE
jgi:RNA polymerase sigma factor (sigma-70 family)